MNNMAIMTMLKHLGFLQIKSQIKTYNPGQKKVLSRSATRETTRVAVCYARYEVLLYLWLFGPMLNY